MTLYERFVMQRRAQAAVDRRVARQVEAFERYQVMRATKP